MWVWAEGPLTCDGGVPHFVEAVPMPIFPFRPTSPQCVLENIIDLCNFICSNSINIYTICILVETETYRGDVENGEGIPPHAPKPYKASIWTHILQEEIVCHWDHYSIPIDRACSHIHIAYIKAPRGTFICMFLHEVCTKISKGGKDKHQCCWNPDKPISITTEKNCTINTY